MQIESLKYQQFQNEDRNWILHEVKFEKINLLVGKNASGKSQTLNLINGLSNILAENTPLFYQEGCYDITFQNSGEKYQYILEFHDQKVINEKLIIGNETKINREKTGDGFIISSNGSTHNFQMPERELKANRRDNSNYPYLENINFWANHVRMFNFSSQNKQSLAIKDPTKKASEFILKNTDAGVIITFYTGMTNYPNVFMESIVRDFNSIGYNISTIELGAQISRSFQTTDKIDVVGFRVKENDLNCLTDQLTMSNGMFRALSLIVHFNYYEFAKIPGVVLIDDIGEGLDYERSTKLIKLLISKAEKSENMQLIMSTNDSFIMNSVDLKYWQIIDREGCDVKFYNIKNSQKNFDEYKFTGLNNFDFFTTGFFKTGFDKQ